MPNTIPPLEYPDRFEVRYVSANGGIRWEHDWVNVSTVCAGDYVGLEEIDDGVWNVYFGPLKLGRFLERHRPARKIRADTPQAVCPSCRRRGRRRQSGRQVPGPEGRS
jgi:hypothetical protein